MLQGRAGRCPFLATTVAGGACASVQELVLQEGAEQVPPRTRPPVRPSVQLPSHHGIRPPARPPAGLPANLRAEIRISGRDGPGSCRPQLCAGARA